MLRFSANLSMLFREASFVQRFNLAAQAGFAAVEFMSPFGYDLDEIAQAVSRTGLKVVQYNFADGDIAAGERGFLSHPDRVSDWRKRLRDAIDLAARLMPKQLNSLAGNLVVGRSREEQLAVLLDNLHWALPYLERAGLPLMLEALNSYDNEAYLLTHSWEVLEILDQVDSPWIRFQCDVYHMQRMEGNLTETLQKAISRIGHVQIADCPGRHEPGTGEINFSFVLSTLEKLGYRGYVGLEYMPRQSTEESLAWLPGHARVQTTALELAL